MHQYTKELIAKGSITAQWLVSQIDENGAIKCTGDLGAYYKCVFPLRCAGYSYASSMVLRQIMNQFYTEKGDLRFTADKKTREPYTSRYSQTYPNGWVVLGAELLGQRDIVRKLNEGMIVNYFDEKMGTFRTSALPQKDVYDSNSAATAVLCLMLTDLKRAERSANFLIELMDKQPDPDKCFFVNVDRCFSYITDLDVKYPVFNAVKFGSEGQATWVLGYPAAALAKLYQTTGKKKYLDYSIKYLETFLKIGEPAFRSYGAGKAMWAASMLYRITGNRKYEEVCTRLIDFFFSLQAEDGSFPIPLADNPDFEGYLIVFDTSPEYCRWFFEVAAELNGV